MQRCADCGHPNRPGVRFCTHCGNPQAAWGTTAKGPTPIVAAVVLAVGLLAFLSIRPIVPREASTATIETSAHVVETSAGVADAAVERAVEPVPAARADVGFGDAAPPADAAMPADVAMPADSAVLADPIVPAIDAPPAEAVTISAAPDAVPSVPPLAPPSVAQPALDVLESAGLVLPTAAPLAMPAPSGDSPHSATLARRNEVASRARLFPGAASSLAAPASPAAAPASPAAAASLPAAPASSSPAKRASIDSAPARRGAPTQHAASWLQKLRTELAACEGDLVVRTICRETAKHRHCASADAWGKVPECPAARLPDLANFN